jgi:hypothetical protein
MTKPIVLLTDSDRKRRLSSISRKIHDLLDPKRWTDSEAFQKAFYSERWALEGDLQRLCEEFSFTLQVGWIHQTPKTKRK